MSETYGRRLREARDRRQLTQDQAAELAGISRAFWSELERGLSIPTIVTAQRIAEGIGVEPYPDSGKDAEIARLTWEWRLAEARRREADWDAAFLREQANERTLRSSETGAERRDGRGDQYGG